MSEKDNNSDLKVKIKGVAEEKGESKEIPCFRI